MPRDVGVVVVAAGKGVRAGGEVPKQYRPVRGVPLLLRALRPFLAHPEVAAVVTALPAEDVASPPDWLAPFAGERLRLVAGGAERQHSVAAALAALPEGCRIVLVHDAARPFVPAATIDAVIAQARRGTAAVAAVPVSDTLKETEPGDATRVRRTVDRERLWRAQTPQGFPRELLERAHREAAAAGLVATDDVALAERIGAPVHVVPDSPRNLKVTGPDDFVLAEALAGLDG